jgi:hypothetical protein
MGGHGRGPLGDALIEDRAQLGPAVGKGVPPEAGESVGEPSLHPSRFRDPASRGPQRPAPVGSSVGENLVFEVVLRHCLDLCDLLVEQVAALRVRPRLRGV